MPRIPYRKLKRAEDDARRHFPHARHVHAMWTPSSQHEIHVEVWASNHSARVLAWEPKQW